MKNLFKHFLDKEVYIEWVDSRYDWHWYQVKAINDNGEQILLQGLNGPNNGDEYEGGIITVPIDKIKTMILQRKKKR